MISPPVLFVLDVGHGSCAVLCDTKGIVVIDAGPRTTLLEFLRSECIGHIDTVLISHADVDHIEGLISLLESRSVTIGKVRLNPDLAKDTAAWRELNWLLDQGHFLGEIDFDTSLTTRHSGDFDCGDIHLEILAPSMFVAATSTSRSERPRRMDSNSRSVVVRLMRNGNPLALLAGDIDEIGFDALLQAHPAPQAPLLVYPHHGGHSGAKSEIAFAAKLCHAIAPTSVIFSIGRGKRATPRPEIVETIRREIPGVRIACTQLSAHCCVSTRDSKVAALLDHFAAGRERGHCCAGTIAIALSSPPTIAPAAEIHLAFVRDIAPNGLCVRSLSTPFSGTKHDGVDLSDDAGRN